MERRAPPPSGPCSWLVYYHGKDRKNQPIYNAADVSGAFISIPYFRNTRVLSCSLGWLILRDYRTSLLSLWNPTTFESIVLPRLFDRDGSLVLWSSPNSPDLRVIMFRVRHPPMCCRAGDDEWTEMAVDQGSRDLFFLWPTNCGGKIYAKRSNFSGLWCVEIVEQPVLGLVFYKLNNGIQSSYRYKFEYDQAADYLMESCGELFSVLFAIDGTSIPDMLPIDVYRLNFETMDWEKVNSVKDRAFFTDHHYCLSSPASSESGRIYFTNYEGKRLYCYDLEDESVFMCPPCPASPTPSPWLTSPNCCTRDEDDHRKRLESDKNGQVSQDEEFQLCSLPSDTVVEVTKHLTPRDYMNFRVVSRFFRSVAPPIKWRTALLRSDTNFAFPLLMFADKKQGLHKFIDPKLNIDHSYPTRIPDSLKDTRVSYSHHGWLLMSRLGAVHLYNPVTGSIISHTDAYERDNSCFFVSKPSAPGCFLVGISFYPARQIAVSIRAPGEQVWNFEVIQGNQAFKAISSSPVFFRDAFYFLGCGGILGELKVEGGNLSWQVLDEPQSPFYSWGQNFLVECGGELLSVYVERVGELVAVHKLNEHSRSWEVVTSLGHYNLFLSRPSSLSAAASPGMDNRIYLAGFSGSEIVFYSLSTNKWHSGRESGQDESSRDLYGTSIFLNSCWIMPS